MTFTHPCTIHPCWCVHGCWFTLVHRQVLGQITSLKGHLNDMSLPHWTSTLYFFKNRGWVEEICWTCQSFDPQIWIFREKKAGFQWTASLGPSSCRLQVFKDLGQTHGELEITDLSLNVMKWKEWYSQPTVQICNCLVNADVNPFDASLSIFPRWRLQYCKSALVIWDSCRPEDKNSEFSFSGLTPGNGKMNSSILVE